MSVVPEPDDRLSAYLDDELAASERAEVDRLLSESEEWRDGLAEVAWARDAVRGLPQLDPPARVERPARTARVARVLAVAAAVVAGVMVFTLPIDKPEEGDGNGSGEPPRTAVEGREGVKARWPTRSTGSPLDGESAAVAPSGGGSCG
jgi:hypothetical protein